MPGSQWISSHSGSNECSPERDSTSSDQYKADTCPVHVWELDYRESIHTNKVKPRRGQHYAYHYEAEYFDHLRGTTLGYE
ncbi:MAG: hypothetical protein MN733_31695 [Nitrososphaera sp.]|nr:hypothetical protein [Nitrososphaera sp.]